MYCQLSYVFIVLTLATVLYANEKFLAELPSQSMLEKLLLKVNPEKKIPTLHDYQLLTIKYPEMFVETSQFVATASTIATCRSLKDKIIASICSEDDRAVAATVALHLLDQAKIPDRNQKTWDDILILGDAGGFAIAMEILRVTNNDDCYVIAYQYFKKNKMYDKMKKMFSLMDTYFNEKKKFQKQFELMLSDDDPECAKIVNEFFTSTSEQKLKD